MTIPAGHSGAYETITSSDTELIDGKGVGTTLEVTVEDTASNAVLISIPKLMPAGEFALVDVGQTMDFRLGTDDISKATAKSVSGSTSIKWSLVAKGAMR